MGTSRTICEALSEVHGWDYQERLPGPKEGSGAVYSIVVEVPSGTQKAKAALQAEYGRHKIEFKRGSHVFVRVSCENASGTSERGGGAGPRAKLARKIRRLVEGAIR